MPKSKISGPAMFMYCLIAIGAVLSSVCFSTYYIYDFKISWVLWTGIVSFMIMYHLWLRIIMGNVSKLFKIDYNMWWFKERSFEKHIYSFLRVKKWKGKALTYNPELFSLKLYSPRQIALTMTKSETDHWINQFISLSSLLFSLIWGKFWIFFATAIAAMAFDGQFILIQRFNRPRILRLDKMHENKKSTQKEMAVALNT